MVYVGCLDSNWVRTLPALMVFLFSPFFSVYEINLDEQKMTRRPFTILFFFIFLFLASCLCFHGEEMDGLLLLVGR